jgi:hypothetical protein
MKMSQITSMSKMDENYTYMVLVSIFCLRVVVMFWNAKSVIQVPVALESW